MRCYNCNQNNIEVIFNNDTNHYEIKCVICNLTIPCNITTRFLLDYNISLEEAEELGKKAYIKDDKNPYSLDSDEIMLNKKWEEGKEREKMSYEREAFSSSSKKLKESAEKNLENISKLKKKVEFKDQYIDIILKGLKKLVKKKYILGYKYKKDIVKVAKEAIEFMEKEIPDS